MTKAARLGEKDVALSRIAESRTVNPRVREFAARMVREHPPASSRLAALAASRGVTIDREDASEQSREADKWNKKSGDEFDQDYLEAMIDSHEDLVDVLENGKDSADREIAAWANRMLPQIKAHLQQAEMLEDSLG